MAHFAQLDHNNIVTQVIVVGNTDILGNDGNESEDVGVAFCQLLFGQDTVWKQTSYNGRIRGVYAGVGYTYREDLDRFIPPSPYPSWTFNETTYEWDPPTPYPSDGQKYTWDEAQQIWALLEPQ